MILANLTDRDERLSVEFLRGRSASESRYRDVMTGEDVIGDGPRLTAVVAARSYRRLRND